MVGGDAARELSDVEQLRLLEQYKPVLRYDRQYDYRLVSVRSMVENPGNLLRTAHGEVIARVDGEPALSLELLHAYPDNRTPDPTDCLCQAPDALGDARAKEGDRRYEAPLYGRVVPDGGRQWLQYWFWLYYNPKNLLGFGKHEGDWEMIQIGLGAHGLPDVLAFAQHNSGEARKAEAVEWDPREGGAHPVVYIAPHSHASYFSPRAHPYVLGIDHPSKDGPEDWLSVELFGPWVDWPGRWGSADRVIAGKVGNGPPTPSKQGLKWTSPARFQGKMRRRALRAAFGKLLHTLGIPFYPKAPQLEGRLDTRRCEVKYRVQNTVWRRSRHLLLTIHDGERVVASRTVRCVGRAGSETFRLASVPASTRVVASTYNRLRQRSNFAEVAIQSHE